jgi:hypothetical protein
MSEQHTRDVIGDKENFLDRLLSQFRHKHNLVLFKNRRGFIRPPIAWNNQPPRPQEDNCSA